MTVNVLAVATAVVPEPLYHLIVPSEPHVPLSEIVCSTPPLYTCAVRTVEPLEFLKMLPVLLVIVSVIASAPLLPVAPCVPMIAGVVFAVVLLVYVMSW